MQVWCKFELSLRSGWGGVKNEKNSYFFQSAILGHMPVPSLVQKAGLAHFHMYEDDIVELPGGDVSVDFSGRRTILRGL